MAEDDRCASSRELGDPADWLAEHGDALYRYALTRLKDSHLARDFVQETLLTAWQQKERFEGRSSARTWLTGILRYKLLGHWRRDKRWHNATDLLGEDESDEQLFTRLGNWQEEHKPGDWSEALAQLERGEVRQALGHCIEQLPERLRRLFTLVEIQEQEREQAAAALDISPNHLAVLIYRARQKLRICLEGKITR